MQENQIQLNFPSSGTTPIVPFSAQGNTYYDFVLRYDPTRAGILGSQPYSLSVNGTDIPIPVDPSTTYLPLTLFDAVAFGGRYSSWLTTRYISDFSLETFDVAPVPLPASLPLLALGALGMGFMKRKRLTPRAAVH